MIDAVHFGLNLLVAMMVLVAVSVFIPPLWRRFQDKLILVLLGLCVLAVACANLAKYLRMEEP